MRANLGSAFFSSQGDEGLAQSVEFAEKWNGRAGGRITTAIAPHAPYTVTDDDLRGAAEPGGRLDHGHPLAGPPEQGLFRLEQDAVASREGHSYCPRGMRSGRRGIRDAQDQLEQLAAKHRRPLSRRAQLVCIRAIR